MQATQVMQASSADTYVLAFDRTKEQDHDRLGGKCASLARMIAAGVRVPPGFTVTTESYASHVANAGLSALISKEVNGLSIGDVQQEEQVSQKIKEALTSVPLPPEVEASIREAYKQFSPGDDLPVAVRSSATAEDLPDASFAGQQDTFLWVKGADSVIDAVKACWASLYNARAISYRAQNDIDQVNVQMAVAVQKMVDAAAAGVAMTLDPVSGDRTKIVIDSAFGLGEMVVSGEVTPDNYVVEKILMDVLERNIKEKDQELVADHEAGCTVTRVIEADRRNTSSLTDEQVLAVAKLAKSLERKFGCPQDVEWAIDRSLPEGENLLALQSRPETVWSQASKPAAAAQAAPTGMDSLVATLIAPIKKTKA